MITALRIAQGSISFTNYIRVLINAQCCWVLSDEKEGKSFLSHETCTIEPMHSNEVWWLYIISFFTRMNFLAGIYKCNVFLMQNISWTKSLSLYAKSNLNIGFDLALKIFPLFVKVRTTTQAHWQIMQRRVLSQASITDVGLWGHENVVEQYKNRTVI